MSHRVITLCLLTALACSTERPLRAPSAGNGASGSSGGGAPVAGTSGERDAGTRDSATGGGQAGGGGSASADAAVSADSGTDSGAPPLPGCRAPSPAVSPGNACPTDSPVTLKTTLVASGFDTPVFVTHAPGDPDARLFVVERGGAIKIIDNGSTRPAPFLSVSPVSGSGDAEQGLLGVAFDPDYAASGRFFVNYTKSTGLGTQNVIESYTVSSDPNVADETTVKLLLSYDDVEWNHNGGMLAFGPDGCLYIGTGDGGGSNDQHGATGNGQRLDTELGKILRIDVDDPGSGAPGNLGGGGLPHIWDYGIRNAWRFSFDRLTGDLYIGDVGQFTWEEIDVEPRGVGHHNFGWRPMEGSYCRGDTSTKGPAMCDGLSTAQMTLPVYEYGHSANQTCVIGGYVYRGSNIPSLQGHYVFGDHMSRKVWAFVWNGSGVCAGSLLDLTAQLAVPGAITSFGQDADGELYITTHADVLRIDAR